MNKFIFLIYVIFTFSVLGCNTQQIRDRINKAVSEGRLTNGEIVAGLKETLINGITQGTDLASRINGYYMNPKIKIPFPEDINIVKTTLKQIGLGDEVNMFVETLNRGAEHAAEKAKPIFINSIKSMTFKDAREILRGNIDAATQYLKKTASPKLKAEFMPKIHESLQQVNATKYYDKIITAYNKIPMLADVNPDIDDYVSQKAIDGLFILVAEEEARIRKDPLARTSDLLKRVFADTNRYP